MPDDFFKSTKIWLNKFTERLSTQVPQFIVPNRTLLIFLSVNDFRQVLDPLLQLSHFFL